MRLLFPDDISISYILLLQVNSSFNVVPDSVSVITLHNGLTTTARLDAS